MNELKEIEDEGLLQRKCLFFIWGMGQRVGRSLDFFRRESSSDCVPCCATCRVVRCFFGHFPMILCFAQIFLPSRQPFFNRKSKRHVIRRKHEWDGRTNRILVVFCHDLSYFWIIPIHNGNKQESEMVQKCTVQYHII